MRFRIGALRFLVLAGLCAGSPLLACGDKFLVAGRGARFQRGGAHPPVAIYAPLSSTLRGTSKGASLDSVLKRAGYRPSVAASPEDLGRILKSDAPGVVVVDVADAPTVAKYAPAAPAGPVILPVLTNASRQEIAEARKTWGVALKSPASGDALLDAVDEAVDLHTKAGKLAELKR